ncbi:MAG: DUF104 domain-containing protein [Chloroflexi bacterium]|nr:DUF104 domain-containing protein [Chloroflexota bacterium]
MHPKGLKRIEAVFSNGKLMSLEPVDLKEGEEVTVSIDDKPQLSDKERLESLMAAAGGWEGLHDPDEFKRMIYQARIDGSRHTPKP